MIDLAQKLDNRGLTSKAQRAVEQHNKVVKVVDIVSDILEELDFRLTFNSPGILSRKHFSDLEGFLKKVYLMWEDINYPFTEEVLVRTAQFDSLNMKMPVTTVPIENGGELVKINDFLSEHEEIDQVLLHPQVTEETFKRESIMARVLLHPDFTEIDLGYKGIQHIRNITEANTVINIRVQDGNLNMDYRKGSSEDIDLHLLERIAILFDSMILVMEDQFLEEENFQKDVVFEFKLVPNNNTWYVILASWEVI